MGLLGPTLPDLALQTGVSLTMASTLATWRAVAYIVGSLFAGLLLEYVDGFVGLSVVLLLQAVTTSLAGYFVDFTLIAFFQAMSSFFSTIMVTGVPFLVFRLERYQARMVAQAAFLLFNVGKTIVPFIVAPFLSPDASRNTSTVTTTVASSLNITVDMELWAANAVLPEPATQVCWAYVIVGGFCLVMFFLYASIALAKGCQWRPKKTTCVITDDDTPGDKVVEVSAEPKDADHFPRQRHPEVDYPGDRGAPVSSDATVLCEAGAPENPHFRCAAGRAPACRTALVISVFLCAIFMQTGMEVIENTLLLSFVVAYMRHTKLLGLILTGFYQGVKVLVCVGIMFLVNRVHPSAILLADVICMTLACGVMTAAVLVDHEVLFFFAIALLAIGMSNYYATVLSWLQGYYPISGRLSSLISVFFGMSGMALPPLTTTLLTNYGAVAFPLILLASSVMCLILWGVLKVILMEPICLLSLSVNVAKQQKAVSGERTPLLVENE